MAFGYTNRLTENLGENQSRLTGTYDITAVGVIVNVRITMQPISGKKMILADQDVFIFGGTGAAFSGMSYTLLRTDTDPSNQIRLVHAYQLNIAGAGVLLVVSHYSKLRVDKQWKNYYSHLHAEFISGAKISGTDIVKYP